MMKLRIAVGFVALFALVAGAVLAGEAVKSGPQCGEELAGPFHPLNVTGPNAGEKQCLYCKNGNNPVAMIFAREVSEPLTTLIKKIDSATADHKEAKMGSFVVFLSDSEDLPTKLKDVAEKESIKECVLSIDNPAGPKGYKVSKDADVTVVLYRNAKVVSNYTFRAGQLNEQAIDRILNDIPKLVK